MISTTCRFCEFKEVDENGNQTNCELNLLQRYKDKGLEVLEVQHDDKHGKNTAFEPQTFCLFRRPKGWKEAVANDIEAAGKTLMEVAREELVPSVTLMVFVPPNTSFAKVQEFTNHVNKMDIKPKKILFMNFARLSPLQFRQNLKSEVPWGMEFMINSNKEKDALRYDGFNLGSKKVETSHLIQMDIDEELRLDYISVIKAKIVDDLERFICVTNEIGKPAYYQNSVYRFLRGNEQADINEKIELLAEKQECPNLIKNYNQIFHSQK
jgi:hypothetical protein